MTLHQLVTAPFPIDILILLGVGVLCGFSWSVGAWLTQRVLR